MARNSVQKYVFPLSVALLCSGCAQILGGNAELPQRRFYDFGTEVVQGGLAQSERAYAVQVQVKTFDVQRAKTLESESNYAAILTARVPAPSTYSCLVDVLR